MILQSVKYNTMSSKYKPSYNKPSNNKPNYINNK